MATLEKVLPSKKNALKKSLSNYQDELNDRINPSGKRKILSRKVPKHVKKDIKTNSLDDLYLRENPEIGFELKMLNDELKKPNEKLEKMIINIRKRKTAMPENYKEFMEILWSYENLFGIYQKAMKVDQLKRMVRLIRVAGREFTKPKHLENLQRYYPTGDIYYRMRDAIRNMHRKQSLKEEPGKGKGVWLEYIDTLTVYAIIRLAVKEVINEKAKNILHEYLKAFIRNDSKIAGEIVEVLSMSGIYPPEPDAVRKYIVSNRSYVNGLIDSMRKSRIELQEANETIKRVEELINLSSKFIKR